VSWLGRFGVVMVVALVLLVRRVEQPVRGLLDLGVALAARAVFSGVTPRVALELPSAGVDVGVEAAPSTGSGALRARCGVDRTEIAVEAPGACS
jgi:hypothetical protein